MTSTTRCRSYADLHREGSRYAVAARRCHDDVVVIDIETGQERARAPVPSLFQSVLFPAAGWDRELYYGTFSTLARVVVV